MTAAAQPTPPRLHCLDGLRGLLAAYVLLHHGMPFLATAAVGTWLPAVFGEGTAAVDGFLVLSGMVVSRALASHPQPFAAFMARRAARLLPCYLIALCLGMLALSLPPPFAEMPWMADFSRAKLHWPQQWPEYPLLHVLLHLPLAHGLVPQAVWGDFDSISARARAGIPPENLHPVTEQDSTDFEKCLSRIDAPLVIAVGFAGARHDHFLAALSTLSRRIGPPCILIAAEDVITLCPPEIALDLRPGTRLSLFPMGPASGYAQGLKWPIDGLDFAPDARIGTSNAATGPVLLQTEGPMLLILPRAHLGTLARAL